MKSYLRSIIQNSSISAVLLFAGACGGQGGAQAESVEAGPTLIGSPADPKADPRYNAGAARFVADAMAGRLPEGSTYRYTVARRQPDGRMEAQQVELGFSDIVAVPAAASTPQDYALNWCERASPSVSVSKSISASSCSKSDAEDTAQFWTTTAASQYCSGLLDTDDGDAACDPSNYDGGTCVDQTSAGVTHKCQVGPADACGSYPFRHAVWKVTYQVRGYCGFPCSRTISG